MSSSDVPRGQVAVIVDTLGLLKTLLPVLASSKQLYIEMRGRDFDCNGTLGIITIFPVDPHRRFGNINPALIDMTALGAGAFTIAADDPKATTLTTIMESRIIPKFLWDIRGPAKALLFHYGVRLRGCTDLQLCESAIRTSGQAQGMDMNQCINRDCWVSSSEIARLSMIKDSLRASLAINQNFWSNRPMTEETIEVCVHDIIYMPLLYGRYSAGRHQNWKLEIDTQTQERANFALSEIFYKNALD